MTVRGGNADWNLVTEVNMQLLKKNAANCLPRIGFVLIAKRKSECT